MSHAFVTDPGSAEVAHRTGPRVGKNGLVAVDPDIDRLEAGPAELSPRQRRQLLRSMLVVLAAAALVFVSGSISALNRDLAQRPSAAPPSTTARPLVHEAVDDWRRPVRVSVLDQPKTDRDLLPAWAAAQMRTAPVDSARLAVATPGVQVFIAGTQSSACLVAIDQAAQRATGDCLSGRRFVAASDVDWMSVSATQVNCRLDVVLVPDGYLLRMPKDSTVSAEGPNVAVVSSSRDSGDTAFECRARLLSSSPPAMIRAIADLDVARPATSSIDWCPVAA